MALSKEASAQVLGQTAFTAMAAPPSRSAKAVRDIVVGFGKYWLWGAMALQDIRLRYRGSILGPIWLTLNTTVMIGLMGVLYPHLFHTSAREYVPYLATGMVIWQFIQSMINDSGPTFWVAQNVILQTPLPFSVYVYRTVARNFIVLGHNFVIVPIVLLALQVPIGLSVLMVVPGLLVLAINSVWIGLFFGIVCTRFRDVPPILTNAVQVLFFVTPIFWDPAVLGKWQYYVAFNPLFDAIDVIRAPLIGRPFAELSWPVLLIVTIIGSVGTFLVFARFRSRIAYWI